VTSSFTINPNGIASYIWSTGETTQQITITTAGSYTVSVADANGCISLSSTGISVTINPLPLQPAITALGSIIFCAGGSVVLEAPSGFTSYTWSTGETTQQITVLASGSYRVAVTNSQNCSSVLSQEIVVTSVALPCTNQAPVINISEINVFVGETVTLNLLDLISDGDNNLDLTTLAILQAPTSGAMATLTDGNLTISYSGVAFSGLDDITIQVFDLFGECTQQIFTIEVIGELIVYNGVSPNNDGQNDRFIIKHIDKIPETQLNTVLIFNRWGDLVWKGINYNNETVSFIGKSNGNDELPTGTYFYKVNFNGRYAPLTGYLSLKR